MRILIRGSGDIGSAVAHRLFGAGYAVVIHDVHQPSATRRKMAFADAIFDRFAALDGISAQRADTLPELTQMLASRCLIPITTLPLPLILDALSPTVLVDGRMNKHHQPESQINFAALTVGLGPNFIAGETTHLAVETAWGESLGRIVSKGATNPLQGESKPIAGHARDRYLYSPAEGIFRTPHQIGDRVQRGQEIACIDDLPLYAPISGVLRGRVGRGAARAYAYLFRHRKLRPTSEGQERLEVIAENTQLGAGYSIAMRDSEMRGAGELLGTRQSGHIAAVGFHLYTRMLAAAVKLIRSVGRFEGWKVAGQLSNLETFQPMGLPVNVDLPLAIGIPADYIPDTDLRLRLYRRLADLSDEAALEALAAEFADRFGPLPEMATNLFYQMRVKMRAEKAGLVSVGMESGQILLRYPAPPEGVEAKRLPDLGPGVRGGKNAYWCMFGREANWKDRLLETLGSLSKK